MATLCLIQITIGWGTFFLGRNPFLFDFWFRFSDISPSKGSIRCASNLIYSKISLSLDRVRRWCEIGPLRMVFRLWTFGRSSIHRRLMESLLLAKDIWKVFYLKELNESSSYPEKTRGRPLWNVFDTHNIFRISSIYRGSVGSLTIRDHWKVFNL